MPFTAEPIHGKCINYLPCLIDFSSTHLFFHRTCIIENEFGKTYENENIKTKLEEKKYKKRLFIKHQDGANPCTELNFTPHLSGLSCRHGLG